MSNLTDFFPGGGGGGAGVLKQQVFTTSGTVDLTSLGIEDGDVIQLFLVGGGSSGAYLTGGQGSDIWNGSITVGTAGTATVTIGAGGQYNAAGGSTSITGGGIPTKSQSSPGHIPGGRPGINNNTQVQTSTNAGFGQGGQGYTGSSGANAPANTGNGGAGGGGASTGGFGGSGIAIIYYS